VAERRGPHTPGVNDEAAGASEQDATLPNGGDDPVPGEGGAQAAAEESGGDGSHEPGASLRRAREAAGLDVATLARRIHLGQATVEDLEANRFDHMPPAYVRGYLRSCARDLGVDPGPWLAAFDRHGLTDPELRAVATRSGGHGRRRRSPGLYWAASVVVVALLGLGVYAWSDRDEAPSLGLAGSDAEAPATDEAPGTSMAGAEDESPALVEAEAAAAPTEATNDAGDAGDARESGLVEAAELAEPVEPVAERAAVAEEPTAPEPVTAADDGSAAAAPGASRTRLVLEVSEPSWVEIRDADDTVVLTGVLSSGDREEVELELPGRAVLGNAPGVQLHLDDTPIDLAPHTRGNNTARVDLEG